jgi:hypothetical protein
MTKKIEDVIKDFTVLSFDEQIERIRHARSARTMERPVAAVKRVKKEAKKRDKTMTGARTLALKLSPEQRIALIAKLKADLMK